MIRAGGVAAKTRFVGHFDDPCPLGLTQRVRRSRAIRVRSTIAARQTVDLPALQRAGGDAGQSTGRGKPRSLGTGLRDVTHQGLAVFQTGHSSASVWKTAESFLRNTDLGGVRLDLVQDKSQRPRPSLKVVQNALLVAIFIVGRAGIEIRHAVTKGVVE